LSDAPTAILPALRFTSPPAYRPAAAPGHVLVSRTVKDLVVDSPHHFTSAGVHTLRGVPGDWLLFNVHH
jgi:class 3 adenylate cyclase